MNRLYSFFALAMGLGLAAPVSAQTANNAKSDTCFVALRIDNADEPYVVESASTGMLKREGRNTVLYTTSPFVKVVNRSSDETKDPNGRYSAVKFEKGKSTVYDYSKRGGDGMKFQPVDVRNMTNFVYFRVDEAKSTTLSFRLANASLSKAGPLQIRYANAATPADVMAQFSNPEAAPAAETPAEVTTADSNEATAAIEPEATHRNAMEERNGWTNVLKSAFTIVLGLLALAILGYMGRKWYRDAKSGTKRQDQGLSPYDTPVAAKDDTKNAAKKAGTTKTDNFMKSDPQVKIVEKIVRVPVEKIVEKRVEVPVEKIVEKRVEVPVEKIVEKVVEKPVEKIVEKRVEVPVEKIVEKVVEKPVEKIVEKVVEKRVEVPVEKIVEKVVEVPVPADSSPEVQRQIDSLRTTLQQKQDEIQILQQDITAYKQVANAAVAEAQKSAAGQIQAAREEAERKAADSLAAARQETENVRQQKAAEIENVRKQMEQQLAAVKAEVEEARQHAASDLTAAKQLAAAELANALQKAARELTAAKQQAADALNAAQLKASEDLDAAQRKAAETMAVERQKAASDIATAKQQAEAAIAAAKQKADEAVAAAKQQADEDMAAARQSAQELVATNQRKTDAELAAMRKELAEAQQKAEELQDALTQKSQEVETTIEQLSAELNTQAEQKIAEAVAAADDRADKRVAEARADVETAQQKVQELEDQLQKPLQISRDGLQASLALIQEHVMQMKDGVEAFNADNNYHNTVLQIAQRFTSFMRWFDTNILQGEAEEAKSVEGIHSMMQDSFRRELSNAYSWVAALLRISSYSAISPKFVNEIKRSGIPLDSLKVATSETVALLGRYGISLIIPHLFVDDFDRDNFRLNNAPLINSFYPQGFSEQELAKRNLIYDMILAGYAIDGVVQKVPEVSAMRAIVD